MPCQARLDAPGALQQLSVRGMERRKPLVGDADRTAFGDRLGRLLRESGTPCYAWPLRPNPGHLLPQTGKVPVAAGMRRLLKGDERILGDATFVRAVLEASEVRLTREEKVRRQGYEVEEFGRKVAEVFGLAPDDIFRPTKRPPLVAARNVLCYWAVRNLRETTAAMARRLGLTQPAISTAVRRGEEIARTQGLQLLEG